MNVADLSRGEPLVEGQMAIGSPIGLRMDQTLTQDATGTLVMLELEAMGVERVCTELSAQYEEIDLSALEPLIACPSSPDHVVPVCEVAGRGIYQAYIGSSANSGLRDFAIAALMVEGKQVPETVSFDVNPTSRQILENLTQMGLLTKLIRAGARLHQAGCNGCIGMGQAPATGHISLRTVPRNFPGRSGTPEDQVYLCSTDPNDWHRIDQGDVLRLPHVRQALRPGKPMEVQNQTKHETYRAAHTLTAR